MLQVQFIKDNQKKVLEGLAKRNFANANTIIDTVLKADENRRKTQVLLDNTLAELKPTGSCPTLVTHQPDIS